MTATGPGRRLTDDEETKAAAMFAAKASDRAVADALGIGAATANRLRHRLADRIAALAGQPGAPAQEEHQAPDEVLAEAAAERAGLIEQLALYEARAAASRAALTQLEVERHEMLAAGRDAQPLRSRRRDAEDDAQDSEDAAELVRQRIARLDESIAATRARLDLIGLRAELAAAVTARGEVCSRSGDRQRAAVLAVREAAEEFTATYREELAAVLRVEELGQAVAATAASLGEPLPQVPPAVSTMLSVPGDAIVGGPLALTRAMYRAREGNVAAVAVQLAEALGYLPPSAEELEADRAMWQERAAATAATVPGAGPTVEHPAHWPASVSLDSDGHPLAPPDPDRPRPQQVVAPGSLGFQPFPR